MGASLFVPLDYRKAPAYLENVMWCVCVFAGQDAHSNAHHPCPKDPPDSTGAIRSERPAVPPHTAMQMKRNALIKGQILEMRGQKED